MKTANALLILLFLLLLSLIPAYAFEECPIEQGGDVRLYVAELNGKQIYKMDMCQWQSSSAFINGSKSMTFAWLPCLEPTDKKYEIFEAYLKQKSEYTKKKKNSVDKLKWRRVE